MLNIAKWALPIFCLGTEADIGLGAVLIGGIEGDSVSRRLGNVLWCVGAKRNGFVFGDANIKSGKGISCSCLMGITSIVDDNKVRIF